MKIFKTTAVMLFLLVAFILSAGRALASTDAPTQNECTNGVSGRAYHDMNENGVPEPWEGVDGLEVRLVKKFQGQNRIQYDTTGGGGFFLFYPVECGDYLIFVRDDRGWGPATQVTIGNLGIYHFQIPVELN